MIMDMLTIQETGIKISNMATEYLSPLMSIMKDNGQEASKMVMATIKIKSPTKYTWESLEAEPRKEEAD